MTKNGFIKMLMIVAGFMCFVVGMILSCDYQGLIHWIGLVALAAGVILLIAGIFSPKLKFNADTASRIIKVLLICAALHAVGIVLMLHVFWLAGLPFVLAGILGLLFLVPAANGFVDDKVK